MTQPSRVFLYAEFQVSVPFSEGVWREANPAMHTVPGLRSKTWLSGINTNSVGGFYEFDYVQNARAYAMSMFPTSPRLRMPASPSSCSMATWWPRRVRTWGRPTSLPDCCHD